MKENENIKVASWIAARLKGIIRPEETEALEEWIAESDEHREFYERMIDWDYLMKRLGEYEVCSLDGVRERMMPTIREEGKRVRTIRWVRRTAAILLIPLLVGGLLVLGEWGKTDIPVVADVLPGKERAILEMADGHRIDLGSERDIKLLQVKGAIVKNDSNVLSYQELHGAAQDSLQFNTITIPRGGEYRLTLADGTRVWLNSQTRLRYPVTFSDNKREVYLEGEAYFEVTRTGKTFEVHCEGMNVQVLGTSFNVMAYGDEPVFQTTLVSGKVRVNSGKHPDDSMILEPGYQVQLDTLTGVMEMHEVNVDNFVGWKEKLFVFDDESMETMMRKLSRWYDVDIYIESPALRKSVFYGVIRRYESISKILDMLKKTQNIDYSIEGQKVVIKEAR